MVHKKIEWSKCSKIVKHGQKFKMVQNALIWSNIVKMLQSGPYSPDYINGQLVDNFQICLKIVKNLQKSSKRSTFQGKFFIFPSERVEWGLGVIPKYEQETVKRQSRSTVLYLL